MNIRNRPHRRNFNDPGHAHEFTFSCYRRYRFLSAERTCNWLAESIAETRATLDVDLWAFVFMPEHVHLIIHPRRHDYDVADIRQSIKEPVAGLAIDYLETHAPEWLPRLSIRKSGRTRRFFWQRGGGYDRNVTEPRTLEMMIDYIHMNPVRRGLVERASDWKWSSAAWHAHGASCEVELDPIPAEWTLPE